MLDIHSCTNIYISIYIMKKDYVRNNVKSCTRYARVRGWGLGVICIGYLKGLESK